MRDAKATKAFSTKSSIAISAVQPNSSSSPDVTKMKNQVHEKLAQNNAPQTVKKSASNRRKKSNGSSKSRGKNSSSADGSKDDTDTTFLLREFVQQLVGKVCDDIAAAGEEVKSVDDGVIKAETVRTNATVSTSKSSVIKPKLGEQEESKKIMPARMAVEDLGAILARQASKQKPDQQAKQASKQSAQKIGAISANAKIGTSMSSSQQSIPAKKANLKAVKQSNSPENGAPGVKPQSSTTSGHAASSNDSSENKGNQNKAQTVDDKSVTDIVQPLTISDEKTNVDGQDSTNQHGAGEKEDSAKLKESSTTEGSTADDQSSQAGVATQGRKKRKRNINRKKQNDKVDAMNDFVLKMLGEGPSSSQANRGGTSGQSNKDGGRQGGQRRQNDEKAQVSNSNNQSAKNTTNGGSGKDGGAQSTRTKNNTGKTQSQKQNVQDESSSKNGRSTKQQVVDETMQSQKLSEAPNADLKPLTEMQKFASFTVNEPKQNELLVMPSQIPVGLAYLKDQLTADKELRIGTQVSVGQTKNAASSGKEGDSDFAAKIVESVKASTKRDKLEIRLDMQPNKDSDAKASSATQPDKSIGTKQRSADQAEKVVTLKVAESLQGQKLMTKDQVESAKADFRARFIELERQKTAESNKEKVVSSLRDDIKFSDKQRSEEQVPVNIECLDSSASKERSLTQESQPKSSDNAILKLGSQKLSETNLKGQQTAESKKLDILENESNVSASDAASVSTDANPFMSIKAQSFKPTAFVPSPNKQAAEMFGNQSTNFNPPDFSPMKLQSFSQASTQQRASMGIPGMPYKSVSLMEPQKDEFVVTSARSGGSNGDGSPSVEIGFNSTPVSTNPFKQPGQLNMQKHKSVAQASNYGARGLSPQSANGFKVPDSSSPFTFQPTNNQVPFNAEGGSFAQSSTYAMGMATDKAGQTLNNNSQWDGSPEQQYERQSQKQGGDRGVNFSSKRGSDEGQQAKIAKQSDRPMGFMADQKKKQSAPFSKQNAKQYVGNQSNAEGSNFGDFEVGAAGKGAYNKTKSQYQAINRGSNERSYPEETKTQFKGKNTRLNVEFEPYNNVRDGSSQESPLQVPAYSNKRQFSGEKKSNKKGGQHQHQLDQKGSKTQRYKHNSKGSPDHHNFQPHHPHHYNQMIVNDGSDLPIFDNDSQHMLHKQSSVDSQPALSTLPLNQANSFLGSEQKWQQSPTSSTSFVPGAFTGGNLQQSPLQKTQSMAIQANTPLNYTAGGFKPTNMGVSGQWEDDWNRPSAMGLLQQNGLTPYYPTDMGLTMDAQAMNSPSNGTFFTYAQGGGVQVDPQLTLLNLPSEEEIIASAGIAVKQIDFSKLPAVEQDTFVSPVMKKQMESDQVYKMLEDRFYKVFDEHILSHTTGISQEIADYEAERSYVHKRIERIAQTELQCERLIVKVFGSLITGLALQSSDMDMAVTGLDISDRTTLIEDMHTLTRALDDWDLVKELKSIETASIPVIKAKIDLKQIRKVMKAEQEKQKREEKATSDAPDDTINEPQQIDSESGDSQDVAENKKVETKPDQNEDLKVQEDDSGEPHWLPIDITFDDSQPDTSNAIGNGSSFEPSPMMPQDPFGLNFGGIGGILGGFGGGFNTPKDSFGPPTTVSKTHLGIASCNLLKEYTSTFPCLREVGILLKQFLSIHDLNSAYLGGISSYSAILLIVAYMKNFKLQHSPHITPSRLLMGFLDFYSNEFDPKLYGINTLLEMSFYAQAPSSQQMFVIVDPVNTQNNTSRNSHRTPEILKKFHEAFTHLKSLVHGEYLRLLKLKSEQLQGPEPEVKFPRSDASESKVQVEAPGQEPLQKETKLKAESSSGEEVVSEPTQKEQKQELLPEASCTTSKAPSGPSPPQKSFLGLQSSSPAFVIKEETVSAEVAQHPLPFKPFFFAQVDLIDHLLSDREDKKSQLPAVSTLGASPGESRPDGGASKEGTGSAASSFSK